MQSKVSQALQSVTCVGVNTLKIAYRASSSARVPLVNISTRRLAVNATGLYTRTSRMGMGMGMGMLYAKKQGLHSLRGSCLASMHNKQSLNLNMIGLGGVRHTTDGHAKHLKTKKAAAKRFIRTGKGKLKRGHAFRGHLTSHKSSARKRRLCAKTLLTGTQAKKMSFLFMNNK